MNTEISSSLPPESHPAPHGHQSADFSIKGHQWLRFRFLWVPDSGRAEGGNSKGFWIGDIPVTNAQWNLALELGMEYPKVEEMPGAADLRNSIRSADANTPVESVSTEDRTAFCAMLNTIYAYRVPGFEGGPFSPATDEEWRLASGHYPENPQFRDWAFSQSEFRLIARGCPVSSLEDWIVSQGGVDFIGTPTQSMEDPARVITPFPFEYYVSKPVIFSSISLHQD
ncbi:MAG: hypothetical protein JWM59_2934 [Verrucomicrobiales bacterium]|nr:hypothetical protein [Verrucomicrobiales bacterium]